jgi:hypothetical protein
MAETTRQKDLLGMLTDLSEDVVQRLSEAPGADRALQALKSLGDRVDELQRQTRGFAELEKRMTALEKRVDAMAKPKAKPKPARAKSSVPRANAKSGPAAAKKP